MDFEQSQANLNAFESKLWKTTQFYLRDVAVFNDNNYSFSLNVNPFPDDNIHSGPYMILKPVEGKRKSEIFVPDDTNIYRVGHKLAQKIIHECKKMETPTDFVIK